MASTSLLDTTSTIPPSVIPGVANGNAPSAAAIQAPDVFAQRTVGHLLPWTTSTEPPLIALRLALITQVADVHLGTYSCQGSITDMACELHHFIPGTMSQEVTAIGFTNPRSVIINVNPTAELSAFDLLSLGPDQSITGDVINAFASTLQDHLPFVMFSTPKKKSTVLIFNTYFWPLLLECHENGDLDFNGVAQFTRRISFEHCIKIIIPCIITDVHWAVATINKPTNAIEWHDSLRGEHQTYTRPHQQVVHACHVHEVRAHLLDVRAQASANTIPTHRLQRLWHLRLLCHPSSSPLDRDWHRAASSSSHASSSCMASLATGEGRLWGRRQTYHGHSQCDACRDRVWRP